MQAIQHFVESMLQTSASGARRHTSQSGQDFAQPHDSRTAVQSNQVQVNAITALQIRGRKQVIHQRFGVDAIRARDQNQTYGRFMADSSRKSTNMGSFLARIWLAICSRIFAGEPAKAGCRSQYRHLPCHLARVRIEPRPL